MPSKPTESTGGNSIDKGVYLSSGTIKSVQDRSNHPFHKNREIIYNSKGDPIDMLLEVVYDDENGAERTKKIFGFYKKDKVSIEPEDWRTWGNEASQFIFAVLTEDEVAKHTAGKNGTAILPSMLPLFVGRSFKEVRYVSGKYFDDKGVEKMSTTVLNYFPFETSDEDIKTAWLKVKNSVKGAYKYSPQIVDELAPKSTNIDDVFPFGENVKPVDDVI